MEIKFFKDSFKTKIRLFSVVWALWLRGWFKWMFITYKNRTCCCPIVLHGELQSHRVMRTVLLVVSHYDVGGEKCRVVSRTEWNTGAWKTFSTYPSFRETAPLISEVNLLSRLNGSDIMMSRSRDTAIITELYQSHLKICVLYL